MKSNISSSEIETNPLLAVLKKQLKFFGLVFAQISNIVFWIEEAIPFEEFFIYDMFLIFSLFFLIANEFGKNINLNKTLTNYICLFAALNNFIITLFFLCWGLFFPEKNLAFIVKVGINGNFQILFDLISLVFLYILIKKYKNKISGMNIPRVIMEEIILILALASTLFIF